MNPDFELAFRRLFAAVSAGVIVIGLAMVHHPGLNGIYPLASDALTHYRRATRQQILWHERQAKLRQGILARLPVMVEAKDALPARYL